MGYFSRSLEYAAQCLGMVWGLVMVFYLSSVSRLRTEILSFCEILSFSEILLQPCVVSLKFCEIVKGLEMLSTPGTMVFHAYRVNVAFQFGLFFLFLRYAISKKEI